jgi:hypothetical protein
MIVNITDTGLSPISWTSEVIKAYSYVLQQRKLYNQSNGKKGAFVVATNSSWGVDGWKPDQAPIWCNFYDTLGKYGILNASAVSNFNENQVDISGDLPTLCPSEHLITVGSTTSNDQYYSSGYSTVSVDLSAPGANVFSSASYIKQNIQSGNLYRNSFDGTSFATPMVTAAIGLLHAHACEKVLDSIKNNPEKGNLLIRQFILRGVDKLDQLSSRSVTGGRINLEGALLAMDRFCYGIEDTTNTNSIIFEDNLKLYPNPGNGHIHILSIDPIQNIQCFDFTGKQMEVIFDEEQINISNLASGVYSFKIQTQNKQFVIKYIKTNQ